MTRAKLYSFRGENLPLSEIAERVGMSTAGLRLRLRRLGEDSPDVFTPPAASRERKLFAFRGDFLNLAQIARLIGIKRSTLWNRIYVAKMPPEEAFSGKVPRGRPPLTRSTHQGCPESNDSIPARIQGTFNWRMLTELEKLERRQQDLARDISALRQKLTVVPSCRGEMDLTKLLLE